jgi:hypothetical protein
MVPKVLFMGVKVDYHKELCLKFGDYCEVYDDTDNTSNSRSIPCVALYPCNNAAGLWAFMSLMTKKIICHLQWIKMKTSELIVKSMNTFDQGKIVKESGVELLREVVKPFERTDEIEGSEMKVLPQDEAKPHDDEQKIKNPVSKVSEETDIPVQVVPEEQVEEMEVIQTDKTVKKKERS